MLAVTAVLFASMLISTLAGVLMQLFSGQFELELGKYFFWHILPATIDMVLMAVMRCSSRRSARTNISAGA